MANSGINPFIYYFRNPKFKESLVKSLKAFCPLCRGSKGLISESATEDTELRQVDRYAKDGGSQDV